MHLCDKCFLEKGVYFWLNIYTSIYPTQMLRKKPEVKSNQSQDFMRAINDLNNNFINKLSITLIYGKNQKKKSNYLDEIYTKVNSYF